MVTCARAGRADRRARWRWFHAAHAARHRALDMPVYGMKLGRVGFLMNKHRLDGLPERIERAHAASLFPLQMAVTDADGADTAALAFNEVSLLRQSNQAAHMEVQLNGTVKLTSWSATASWSPRRPARPPTTSPRTARSCRWMPTCWR